MLPFCNKYVKISKAKIYGGNFVRKKISKIAVLALILCTVVFMFTASVYAIDYSDLESAVYHTDDTELQNRMKTVVENHTKGCFSYFASVHKKCILSEKTGINIYGGKKRMITTYIIYILFYDVKKQRGRFNSLLIDNAKKISIM